MHKVVRKIKESISEVAPDFATRKFLLAVSAGIDSMALLNVCVTLRIDIEVAHCNFQLRGYESDSDQKFLTDYCADLGIPMHTKKFNVETEKQKGESVQMTARRLRFSWFDELISERSFDFLLLAHHLDDQIESFFINFLRGTGVKGLVGIRKLNGNRLRPMLELTKNDVEMYANYLEMEYREDSSNHDYKYARNKIRHHLIPLLKELRPELHDVFLKNSRRIASAQEALDEGMEQLFDEINMRKVTKDWFFNIPYYYQHRFLENYGFNTTQLENLRNANVGSNFASEDHRIHVGRDAFEIKKREEENRHQYKIPSMDDFHCVDLSFIITEKEGPHIENSSKNKVSVDASKIEFPMILRKWKEGDSFKPIGMHGTQKLSDFFVNEKLDHSDKQAQWLLVNANEKIIWIIGRRLSEEFKVTSKSKTTLVFETKSVQ